MAEINMHGIASTKIDYSIQWACVRLAIFQITTRYESIFFHKNVIEKMLVIFERGGEPDRYLREKRQTGGYNIQLLSRNVMKSVARCLLLVLNLFFKQ